MAQQHHYLPPKLPMSWRPNNPLDLAIHHQGTLGKLYPSQLFYIIRIGEKNQRLSSWDPERMKKKKQSDQVPGIWDPKLLYKSMKIEGAGSTHGEFDSLRES